MSDVQHVKDAICQPPSLNSTPMTLMALPQEIRLNILQHVHGPGSQSVIVCTHVPNNNSAALCNHQKSPWPNNSTFRLGGSTLKRFLRKLRVAYGTAVPFVCKTLLSDCKVIFSSPHPSQIDLKFCSKLHARHMWEALNGKRVRKLSLRIPHAKFMFAKTRHEIEYTDFDINQDRLLTPRIYPDSYPIGRFRYWWF